MGSALPHHSARQHVSGHNPLPAFAYSLEPRSGTAAWALHPAKPMIDLSRISGSCLATLGIGLAVGQPIGAAAEPLEAQPEPTAIRRLSSEDRPPGWLGENVRYKKGSGLEYWREMKVGEQPIEVGLQGPI